MTCRSIISVLRESKTFCEQTFQTCNKVVITRPTDDTHVLPTNFREQSAP